MTTAIITRKFVLTETHIKLLQRTCTSWDDCEFGAPEIDPKRPYGNSHVYQDMLEILGLKKLKSGIYEFKFGRKKWLLKGEDEYNIDLDDEESLEETLRKLHEETQTALEIILNTKSFKPGTYVEEDYGDWKLKT